MRFENITPLEQRRPRGCDEFAHRRLLRVAAEVRARTGCRCWFNSLNRELAFGPERDGMPRIVWSVPIATGGGGIRRFDPVTEDTTVDDICHVIGLARVDPRLKARWRERKQVHQQANRKLAIRTEAESRTPELASRAAHTRKKREMGKHFKGQAVVAGLKNTL